MRLFKILARESSSELSLGFIIYSVKISIILDVTSFIFVSFKLPILYRIILLSAVNILLGLTLLVL